MMSMPSDLTPEEKRNGWTVETLRKYLAERDNAVNRVHRMGCYADIPEPLRIISGLNPQDWPHSNG